jgi:capsular polysaccharide biosynthesis protein
VPALPAPRAGMSGRERGQAPAAPAGFDPEAEQEVDFSRYARLLAMRWWLPAAGLVIGAVIGYAVSLGGSQVYAASSSVYLGQPYSASGNIQLQNLQTNPSTVTAIVHSQAVDGAVAALCKAKVSAFRGGISTQSVAGNLSKNGQNPIVKITVQAKKAKVAACTANELAKKVVERTSVYAVRKINNFVAEIEADSKSIASIQAGISSPNVSTTDKLILLTSLRADQQDRLAATQLLLQAKQVEEPQVLTAAASQRVTARSRRNTVVVAALIGLVLGALVALLWDRVAPKVAGSDEE